MPGLPFTRNDRPTLGVEVELQLVDAETFELRNAIEEVLRELPSELHGRVKPELMQCYIELNTKVCQTVREAGEDLLALLRQVEAVADRLGLKLFWAATHPFSSWRNQRITVNDRYYRLVDLMQDVARRLVAFGLHVHVGVDTGDKAVMVCDHMLQYLPLLLALSANSPFWEGRNTGLYSNRSKIMEGLPTAGLPYQMRNWSEYVWLVRHLEQTGFINTIREIWWDIRPHNNFGTVEIRVCDMPPSIDQVLALTALIQCLVTHISTEIDSGTFRSPYHPMMVQQNKWRATRFGPHAQLVDHYDHQQYPVAELAARLVDRLMPTARELQCVDELKAVAWLPARSGADEQLRIFEETGSRRDVVREMLQRHHWRRSRLLAPHRTHDSLMANRT
ncbi:MAG: YbdK family carboxylate-amine ligase [Planctomycetota bacterium]|nr:MAG: YbdK family carboxylate-amine ligase [Planctomycetota bacterium]